MKFKLKIILIDDWFDTKFLSWMSAYSDKVEGIIPQKEHKQSVDDMKKFIKDSDAHVVFIDSETGIKGCTGPELLDACIGKLVYNTSPFIAWNPESLPFQPEFPRIGPFPCKYQMSFDHREVSDGNAFFTGFIHNLRHFVEAKKSNND